MSSRPSGLLALLVALSAATAGAQQTTVQLPSFNFTTVNTTVNVPDGGSALLGGIKRAATGSVERGVPLLSKVPVANRLFRNRAIGQEFSSSMMHATANIIILDELEKEVMQRAYASRAARGDRRTFQQLVAESQAEALRRELAAEKLRAEQRRAAFLAQHVRRAAPRDRTDSRAVRPTLPDVETIRRQNEAARQQRAAEAALFFEKGRAAEAAGKQGAARVYYHMAARRAKGELQQQVLARLASLSGQTGSSRPAGEHP